MATKLPYLPDVERVGSSVIRILGGNPSKFTLQGTNTYLLGPPNSRARLLIDTAQGLPTWLTNLSSVLRTENATITTCLITHWHHDHVGGVEDLKTLCPGVEIWKFMPEEWGDGERREEVQGIEDGMVWEVGGEKKLRVRALHTPGHTVDHCCFIMEDSWDEEEKGGMFTGDNVLGHGTSVFTSLPTYLTSLNLMFTHLPLNSSSSSHHLTKAYPSHGSVIPNAHSKFLEYISHRKQREDEILAVLNSSSSSHPTTSSFSDNNNKNEPSALTPTQIVQIVYKDVPKNLHEAAERGVVQILHKLEGEGKVRNQKGKNDDDDDDDDEMWSAVGVDG